MSLATLFAAIAAACFTAGWYVGRQHGRPLAYDHEPDPPDLSGEARVRRALTDPELAAIERARAARTGIPTRTEDLPDGFFREFDRAL